MPGETRSGDLHVVAPFPGGVLVGVIDGLGHGEDAADAALAAAGVLAEHAAEPLPALVERCHEAIRTTRGVALSVAALAGPSGDVSWLGVGNVEATLFRADPSAGQAWESLVFRGGVVGYRLPPLRSSIVPVRPGDTLVFTTDGVGTDALVGLGSGASPTRIAEDLLSRFALSTDDALVLVARYRGEPA